MIPARPIAANVTGSSPAGTTEALHRRPDAIADAHARDIWRGLDDIAHDLEAWYVGEWRRLADLPVAGADPQVRVIHCRRESPQPDVTREEALDSPLTDGQHLGAPEANQLDHAIRAHDHQSVRVDRSPDDYSGAQTVAVAGVAPLVPT